MEGNLYALSLRRTILTAGFTCQLLLVTLTVWTTTAEASLLAADPSLSELNLRLRSLCFCLTFLTGALIFSRFPRINSLRLSAAITGLLIAGVVGQLIGLLILSVPLIIATGLMMSVGTAAFFLLWEHALAQESLRFVGVCLGVSMALSGGLYAMLYPVLDSPVTIILFSLVTGALLIASHSSIGSQAEIGCQQVCSQHTAKDHLGQMQRFNALVLEIWPSLICVVAIYLVTKISRTTAIRELSDLSFFNMASMAAMVFSGVLLAILWYLFRNRISIAWVFQIMFPFVATGFLILPFLNEGYYAFFVGFTFIFVSLIASLIMISSIQYGKKHNLQAISVYGFIGGLCYLAALIGDILGNGVKLLGEYGFVQILAISFVCLYILSMVLLALRKDVAASIVPPPECPVDYSEGMIEYAENPVDHFDHCCDRLSNQHGLSQRESEVLKMLARGRDLPTISSHLFISKGTVQTHCKNLYRKLQIHSKQELIDLIESQIQEQ